MTRCSIATTSSPGSGYFQALQHRVADLRLDEVHVADLALVLLVGGDLLRVGRPEDDGAVARRPAGVVGGVAEVLHAVGRERVLLPRRDVADPEVPVPDEHGALAVGRRDGWRRAGTAPAAAAPAASSPGRGVGPGRVAARRARGALHVARPAATVDVERHRLAVGRQLDRLERQLLRVDRRRRPPSPGRRRASRDRTPARATSPPASREELDAVGVALRYQKRSSGSQFAVTLPPTTSGFTAAARNFSARA